MTQFVLGQQSTYPNQYDPSLLFPISRGQQRSKLGISDSANPPFFGVDIWNAYEMSWLNSKGKPQVAIDGVCLGLGEGLGLFTEGHWSFLRLIVFSSNSRNYNVLLE